MPSGGHDDDVKRTLTDEDYARLLALRTSLREFHQWSQRRAAGLGLTTAQHQLLLAVRGHDNPRGPTISEVAEYLLVRHHTAVGLINRAHALGLVTRSSDPDDHRVVRLVITAQAAELLSQLSAAHLEELRRVAPLIEALTGHPAQPGGATGAG